MSDRLSGTFADAEQWDAFAAELNSEARHEQRRDNYQSYELVLRVRDAATRIAKRIRGESIDPTAGAHHNRMHELWTKAVGEPGYVKAQWGALANALTRSTDTKERLELLAVAEILLREHTATLAKGLVTVRLVAMSFEFDPPQFGADLTKPLYLMPGTEVLIRGR